MTLTKKTSTTLFRNHIKNKTSRDENSGKFATSTTASKKKSCEKCSLWWGKLCEQHREQVEKARFSMKSLSVFIFPHVFPLKKFSSAWEKWKLSLKLLFLNKCFSHQSYRCCVFKTPAVLRLYQCDKGTRKIVFLPRFSPEKLFFSLTWYAKHSETHRRWFPFSLLVVYDGSLLECHDAFENNLMMVCHWTRILSLSKRIYRFLFLLHTFHEFFKLMPKMSSSCFFLLKKTWKRTFTGQVGIFLCDWCRLLYVTIVHQQICLFSSSPSCRHSHLHIP